MTHLVLMNDEQREAIKLKRLVDQDYARSNTILNHADENYWRTIASEKGLRLPQWHILGTEIKYIKRACRKLGVDVKEYTESTGFKTLKEFAETNHKWSALAMVGLVIEYAADKGL